MKLSSVVSLIVTVLLVLAPVKLNLEPMKTAALGLMETITGSAP